MKIAEFLISLTLDRSGFDSETKQATEQTRQTAQQMETRFKASTVAIGNLMASAVKKGISLVKSLGQVGLSYNQEIENYTTNFKVMLGDAEAAVAKVEELKTMAAKTPFGLGDLAGATQNLLAYNVQANKTQTLLQQLGDIALGDKNKLNTLSSVFGQISMAGKLLTQDYKQLINVGFNPLSYIVKRVNSDIKAYGQEFQAAGLTAKAWNEIIADGNVTLAEMQDIMSAGAISVQMVEQSFADATSEGGQFFNGMAESSQTLTGLLSTLKDDASALVGKLAEPFTNLLKAVLPVVDENIQKISDAIDRVFHLGSEEVEAAPPALENLTQASQAWLDEMLGVWTDGEVETDEIVKKYTDGFTTNTDELAAALKARQAALEKDGMLDVSYDDQIAQLRAYDAEIEELLKKKQSKLFTPEDEERLTEIVAAKTEMEQTLSEALTETEVADNPLQHAFDGVADVINGVGDAIVYVIEHWDEIKEKVKGGLVIAASFAGGSVLLKIVEFVAKVKGLFGDGGIFGAARDAVGTAITGGMVLASAKIVIGVITNWPTDEELEAHNQTLNNKLSKLEYTLAVTLGMPPDADIYAWALELNQKIRKYLPKAVGDFLFPESEAEKMGLPVGSGKGSAWNADNEYESNIEEGVISAPVSKKTAEANAAASESAQELSGSLDETSGSVDSMGDTAGKVTSGLYSAAAAAEAFTKRLGNLKLPSTGYVPERFTNVAEHAEGGIFSRPTLFPSGDLVGEAGSEAIIPISKLWDEMGRRMNLAMSVNSIDYDRLAQAITKRAQTFAVNGKEFARVLSEDNAHEINDYNTVVARGMGG